MKKNIVAFAGSNSLNSINKMLVAYTLREFAEFDIDFIDLNDFEMPLYSIDRQLDNGIPEKANIFRNKIINCDALICSLAEHNGSFSVAFKNIFDWCSRVEKIVFANKPMLLMSTSPSRSGGIYVLEQAKASFPRYGAIIIETFSLPSYNQNFIDNEIVDPALKVELMNKIDSFKEELLK